MLHATHNIAEPSENPQPKYEKEINLERDNLTSNHFEINLWKRGLPGLGVTQLPGWSVPTNGWPGAGVCGFGEPEPTGVRASQGPLLHGQMLMAQSDLER